MSRRDFVAALVVASLVVAQLPRVCSAETHWPDPIADVVPGASGFVVIPGVAVPPMAQHTYKAVFDATRGATRPADLLPAIDMAGSELNAFGAMHVPLANARFAIIFHGDALDGILDDAHYRAKFGMANPNLKPLADMKRAGVKLYVCGQNLAFAKIDPATLSPDVTVASDALIVSMELQGQGYALLSY